MSLLTLSNCTIRFGGILAVSDINLTVESSELLGVIGPNGAGKTTLFNLITGIYAPTAGEILFNGEKINGFPVHKIAKRGIGRTFQNIRLYPELSVFDNVRIGFVAQTSANFFSAILQTHNFKRDEIRIQDSIQELLSLFDLQWAEKNPASGLSYGDQRRLEIVRALATKPKLLLLDEPAAGMNPTETTALKHLIQKVKSEFGISVVLVEHDMSLVMDICERIYVLDYGIKIAEGTPKEIQENKKVIEAYLGKPA